MNLQSASRVALRLASSSGVETAINFMLSICAECAGSPVRLVYSGGMPADPIEERDRSPLQNRVAVRDADETVVGYLEADDGLNLGEERMAILEAVADTIGKILRVDR